VLTSQGGNLRSFIVTITLASLLVGCSPTGSDVPSGQSATVAGETDSAAEVTPDGESSSAEGDENLLDLQEVKSSCLPANAKRLTPEELEEVALAWASCESQSARVFVAGLNPMSSQVFSAIVTNPDVRVLGELAQNPSAIVAFEAVFDGASPEVRAGIARSKLPTDQQRLELSQDPEEAVRVAVAESYETPNRLLSKLSSDSSLRVRDAATKRLLGGTFCGSNVPVDAYLGVFGGAGPDVWQAKRGSGEISLLPLGTCRFLLNEQDNSGRTTKRLADGTWSQKLNKVSFSLISGSLLSKGGDPDKILAGKLTNKGLVLTSRGKQLIVLKSKSYDWAKVQDDLRRFQPGSDSSEPSIPEDGVYYQVSGTTSSASVTYRTSSGTSQAKVRVPWSNKISDLKPGAFLYVSAQNETKSGSVSCRIVVDGVIISENTSSGAFKVVSCEGRY
jgi:hypothetical protein